ncbi:hypothetical protein [[Eubacterium] cellulosolvens]
MIADLGLVPRDFAYAQVHEFEKYERSLLTDDDDLWFDTIIIPHPEQNRTVANSILKHSGHWMMFLLRRVILSNTDRPRFLLGDTFPRSPDSNNVETEPVLLELKTSYARTSVAAKAHNMENTSNGLSVREAVQLI